VSPLHHLGFIGIGKMGWPMASRLHQAGFQVTVADADAAVVSRFIADQPGARAASGPQSFAEVDALILMLPTSDIVEAVLEDGKTAAALRAGTLVVDMSSSVPTRTRDLAARLAGGGLRFVDAPVSGGVRGAIAGRLAVLAGGEQADLDQLAPVFAPLASTVIAVGPVGSGHAAKALNNLVSAATMSATVEALRLGMSFGISPAIMTEVLNSSSGRSNTSENKVAQFMTSGTFASGFALHLMAKDVGIAVDLADVLGEEAEVSREVARQWRRIAGQVTAEADHTQMYELI
jgi:3-hydroxyisobutyrate dehydrogenase